MTYFLPKTLIILLPIPPQKITQDFIRIKVVQLFGMSQEPSYLVARLEAQGPLTQRKNKESRQDLSTLNKHLKANKQKRFLLKVKCLNLKRKHEQTVIQHLMLCQSINSDVQNK